MKDWLTAEETAERLGKSLAETYRKFREGIIVAKRHGGAYKVDPTAVEKYLKNPIPPGNPDIAKIGARQGKKNKGRADLFKFNNRWRKRHGLKPLPKKGKKL